MTQTKNKNNKFIWLTTGFCLAVSSLLLLITINNTTKPNTLIKSLEIKNEIMDQCVSSARVLGFKNIKINDNSINISQSKVKDPMDFLYQTTLLKSECNDFTMVDYCLGNDCATIKGEVKQFRMELKLIQKKQSNEEIIKKINTKINEQIKKGK